jgi:hypothetical protein
MGITFPKKLRGMEDLKETLIKKLKTLDETIWEGRVRSPQLEAWLDNFSEDIEGTASERIHGLYLLGQFMYFGDLQIRELLKALFRDLFRYPIVAEIRRSANDTLDLAYINQRYGEEQEQTRFLGIGNPAESGTHLLYFFRQENQLPKTLFIHSHQIFTRRRNDALSKIKPKWLRKLIGAIRGRTLALRDPNVKRYIFIDDICGSGSQAEEYSVEILQDLKSLKPDADVAYLSLFATSEGLKHIRTNTLFDRAGCIFELDETFKCFCPDSRYFKPAVETIEPEFAKQMCLKYGRQIFPNHPLGYDDGQLLLGLHHNTPDNTLPILWGDDPGSLVWAPIFKRYPKIYG